MKLKKTPVVTTSSKSTPATPVKGKPAIGIKTMAPKATKPVPATKPAPTSQTAAPLGERNGVNIGATTGLRVMAYQDKTLAENDGPHARFTDTELAALWRKVFPQSRAVLNGRIDESIVRGVRNLFNQGTGGHGTPGLTHQSRPYILDGGKRVPTEYTRARKASPDAAATTPVAAGARPATPRAAKPAVPAQAPAKVPAKGQAVTKKTVVAPVAAPVVRKIGKVVTRKTKAA